MTGKDWILVEMEAAILRGPHQSAREAGAIQHFEDETREKVAAGQARVVLWDDIRHAPPRYHISQKRFIQF